MRYRKVFAGPTRYVVFMPRGSQPLEFDERDALAITDLRTAGGSNSTHAEANCIVAKGLGYLVILYGPPLSDNVLYRQKPIQFGCLEDYGLGAAKLRTKGG